MDYIFIQELDHYLPKDYLTDKEDRSTTLLRKELIEKHAQECLLN